MIDAANFAIESLSRVVNSATRRCATTSIRMCSTNFEWNWRITDTRLAFNIRNYRCSEWSTWRDFNSNCIPMLTTSSYRFLARNAMALSATLRKHSRKVWFTEWGIEYFVDGRRFNGKLHFDFASKKLWVDTNSISHFLMLVEYLRLLQPTPR